MMRATAFRARKGVIDKAGCVVGEYVLLRVCSSRKWECGERVGDPAEGSIEAGSDAVHERLHLVPFGLMGLVKRDKRLR